MKVERVYFIGFVKQIVVVYSYDTFSSLSFFFFFKFFSLYVQSNEVSVIDDGSVHVHREINKNDLSFFHAIKKSERERIKSFVKKRRSEADST
jgi:hypothetical protein